MTYFCRHSSSTNKACLYSFNSCVLLCKLSILLFTLLTIYLFMYSYFFSPFHSFFVSLSYLSLALSPLVIFDFSLFSPVVFHYITSFPRYLCSISFNLSSFCLTTSLFYPLISQQSETHNTVHVSEYCAVGSMPSCLRSTNSVHCLLSVLRVHGKLLLFISVLHKSHISGNLVYQRHKYIWSV